MTPEPEWVQASDDAVLAVFGGPPALITHARVLALYRAFASAGLDGVRNLHPAYCSLLVVFDTRRWTSSELIAHLRQAAASDPEESPPPRRVEVPVCCSPQFAPDLDSVAAAAGLSPRAAAERLAAAAYRVAFLGFAPGFPYLLGLPPELAAPRLERPRVRVPAGSVAVAGSQAGIYPSETPGGWRLVGRTPLRMFDASRDPMSLLLPGDELRFTLIDDARFEELARP